MGRGIIFHMLETLQLLPCVRPLSPSTLVLNFGACSLWSLCRCGVIHIGLSQEWDGWRQQCCAGVWPGWEASFISGLWATCKVCAVFGSLMKISTYMLIIFLTAVITTEWLEPFRLQWTGCKSPCSTAALLSPRTAGNRKANKLN